MASRQDATRQLADILGLEAGSPALPALLQQCNPPGDVAAAVELYYSKPTADWGAQHGGRSTGCGPEQTLRGLGVTGTAAQIALLRRRAGGSVEEAIELWYEQGARHPGA